MPASMGLNKLFTVATIALFIGATFLSVYKLTESPPTWMDEGIIINSARVWSETGHAGLQIAPGIDSSANILTTDYPVIAPIALTFKLFGVGLLQARSVMVAYLILFFLLAFTLIRRYLIIKSDKNAKLLSLCAFALIISFAPIYGDGKNVLGELPGLVFLMAFLFFAYKTVDDYIQRKSLNIWPMIGAALSAGLSVATKPGYIALIPSFFGAIIICLILNFRNTAFIHNLLHPSKIQISKAIAATIAFVIPLVILKVFQFQGESLGQMISFYASRSAAGNDIISNFKLFFTQSEPAYFLIIIAMWTIACLIRIYRKEKISIAELTAFTFSILISISFLRSLPYYRYFFPAQVLAILFLVPNLSIILSSLKILKDRACLKETLRYCFIGILIVFQFYALQKTSWVAQYYQSTQSAELSKYFSTATSTTFFLYQTPEIATFVKTDHYYQFFNAAANLPVGSSSLIYLTQGVPEKVITNSESSLPPEYLSHYKLSGQITRYHIWSRKP